MLNFFRRIRKGLLKDQQLKKYSVYAFGEVLLVVVGILIALQVSNWNENLRKRAIEQEYLLALKDEFLFNKQQLQATMNRNKSNADNAVIVSNHMGLSTPKITEKEFSVLMIKTLMNEVQFRPNQGVYDEIISSGKLGIFKNTELRFALSAWSGTLFKVRFQEQEHANFRYKAFDISMAKGNLRKSSAYYFKSNFGLTPSEFEMDINQITQSLEFDNQLVGFIQTARFLNNNYYKGLDKKIDIILELIEAELN